MSNSFLCEGFLSGSRSATELYETSLQSFMGKFKVAEQAAAVKRSGQTSLIPLLFDVYNPHETTK